MKNKYWKLTAKILLYSVISLIMGVIATIFIAYAYYHIFDSVTVRHQVIWVVSMMKSFFTGGGGILFTVLSLSIAIILVCLFTKSVTKRLNAILNAVSQMRRGNYRVLLPNDIKDGLGKIEQEINALAGQVQDSFDERQEIEQSKDDFILNIAHDLRTPLTSIIGYLAFISETQLDPEISAKYASIAFDKSKRLEALVETLFDVANLDMDAVLMDKKEINLLKFLRQMQDEMYPQLYNMDMELRLKIPDSFPAVRVDGYLMARVFDNLILNAIRYAREGKFIDVEAEIVGKNIRISFITHANPVPIHELELIFGKFYRLEKSRATSTGGTGLGLFISRRIVELHDGTLTARQTPHGTAFDICLPKILSNK